ncbi:hypothetical protein [Actinoplanes teichomyceticus]|uniref:Uncharacterized protein n=1 Tax=Actinoplanes teichomyceticus TaxID=1867 RepID=A0A561WAT9_ACTTI|nr:hypothetical protein [Actinoplanes teichomyceticus]TWG20965.1 hypothetical protein FHX34_103494 [Actinoplanes teichomyceticus]GIF14784.1 hypothetical protein Ate01nite_48160 [Actinoplanes teichomyceticus]
MSAPQTYWLADPDGYLAPAEGAARRDELIAAGWALADNGATDSSQVWIYHPELGAWAKTGFGALPAFEARGWEPRVPQMADGDSGPFVDPQPVTTEPKTTEAEPPAKPKTETKKETDRA